MTSHFSGRRAVFIYEKVNVPQIDEDNAYFLHKPQSATQEFNVWLLDLKIYGFWIQLGVTFGDTLEFNLHFSAQFGLCFILK